MSPSDWHDYYKSLLGSLVDVLVEELELDYVSFGSMTLKREKTAKGTEPDECFYITSADRVIGLTGLDLDTAPPPDLAIEIDVAHQSQSKVSIYAALGVPEIWRYRKGQMSFYKLSDGQYAEIAASEIFPFLTPQVLASSLNQDYIQSVSAVKRDFRKWVRANKPA